MFSSRSIFAALAIVVALWPITLAAQDVSFDDVAEVTILPGWRTENGTQMAALRIALAPGWKTYWRTPGEAGIPPSFNWQGSRNLSAVRLHWPIPKVFDINGLRSIGYQDVTVLPIELTPLGDGPITLSGEIELGVCQDICIPVKVALDARLPMPGAHDPAISASLANQPLSARKAQVGAVTCALEPIADGLRLTARITLPKQGAQEYVAIEMTDRTIWVSGGTTRRTGNQLIKVADLVPAIATPFLFNRSDVRFTVLAGARAVEINGCTAG